MGKKMGSGDQGAVVEAGAVNVALLGSMTVEFAHEYMASHSLVVPHDLYEAERRRLIREREEAADRGLELSRDLHVTAERLRETEEELAAALGAQRHNADGWEMCDQERSAALARAVAAEAKVGSLTAELAGARSEVEYLRRVGRAYQETAVERAGRSTFAIAAAERRGYERGVRAAVEAAYAGDPGRVEDAVRALLDEGQQPGEEG